MRICPKRGSQRSGVAAVELAFLMPLLLLLLVGVWEVGRIIHVQTLMANAARDGARIAAQARTVNMVGSYTEIRFASGTSIPNIEDTVRAYLAGSGITNLTGVTVTFQFLDGDTTLTDPYQGVKNQQFRIVVTVPYKNVRWTTLSILNPTTLTAEVRWSCLVDDPFTMNTEMPGWNP